MVIATKIANGDIEGGTNVRGYYVPHVEGVPDACYDNAEKEVLFAVMHTVDSVVSQLCEKFFGVKVDALLQQGCSEPSVIVSASATDSSGDALTDEEVDNEDVSGEDIDGEVLESLAVRVEGSIVASAMNEDLRQQIDSEIELNSDISQNLVATPNVTPPTVNSGGACASKFITGLQIAVIKCDDEKSFMEAVLPLRKLVDCTKPSGSITETANHLSEQGARQMK
eukprot:gene23558-28529_t